MNTAVALGYFDGVHIGHKAVLDKTVNEAKKSGLTPVAFTFVVDKTGILKGKGIHDIQSLDERLRFIKENGADRIVVKHFSEICEMSPEIFFEKILLSQMHAKLICCGKDFRFGSGAQGNAELLAKFSKKSGIKAFITDDVKINNINVSSTSIRECLATGSITEANRMLGRNYSIYAKIQHGHSLGHTLGFPTINQFFEDNCIVPKHGVYVSQTEVNGISYPSVTNIGIRPTIENNVVKANAETYIIGFGGNIYDKYIRVSLLDFIRDEKTFCDVEVLTEQIKNDAKIASMFFTNND